MIYVSNIIQVHRRSEYEPVGIECLWIEIVNHTCNFFLCCIYRPPHADNRFWTNFLWSLDKVGEISDKIVIVGDLNVDFLNIPQSHPIVDVMSNYSLINNIHEPTRISSTTRTLIDLFSQQ